ncbi:hypothetical protein HYW53_01650 [Candidatus Giovannonibacteria bacterium]|nr:hypothetical protein [Candidatus Giovannonibacteria bacterium]
MIGYFIPKKGASGLPTKTDNRFSGLEEKLNELNKDIEFYRNIGAYASLLDDRQYEHVSSEFKKLGEGYDKEHSNLQDLFILYSVVELSRDADSEKALAELKDRVKKLRESSSLNKDEAFSKNNECAKLSPSIKENLSDDEEFKFMFYSPSMNSCLYVTYYSEKSAFGAKEYYAANSFRIYDSSTSKQLKDFPDYYYNYPYLSKDETDRKTAAGKRDYAKYILENSGYNADLIKDYTVF